jgi:hypothetical protein
MKLGEARVPIIWCKGPDVSKCRQRKDMGRFWKGARALTNSKSSIGRWLSYEIEETIEKDFDK